MLSSKDEILELTKKIDQQQSFYDGEKEGLKSIYDSLLGFEMRPDAFKSALKLRKMKPTAMQAWLDTFDAVRDALGLDAQLDLEDVIDRQSAAEATVEIARKAWDALPERSRQAAAQEKAADADLSIGKGKTKGNGRSKSSKATEAPTSAA